MVVAAAAAAPGVAGPAVLGAAVGGEQGGTRLMSCPATSSIVQATASPRGVCRARMSWGGSLALVSTTVRLLRCVTYE